MRSGEYLIQFDPHEKVYMALKVCDIEFYSVSQSS